MCRILKLKNLSFELSSHFLGIIECSYSWIHDPPRIQEISNTIKVIFIVLCAKLLLHQILKDYLAPQKKKLRLSWQVE